MVIVYEKNPFLGGQFFLFFFLTRTDPLRSLPNVHVYLTMGKWMDKFAIFSLLICCFLKYAQSTVYNDSADSLQIVAKYAFWCFFGLDIHVCYF